jgi:hypothetical protein
MNPIPATHITVLRPALKQVAHILYLHVCGSSHMEIARKVGVESKQVKAVIRGHQDQRGSRIEVPHAAR